MIAGAIVISLYIIYSWIRISKGQVTTHWNIHKSVACCKVHLCGSALSPLDVNLLLSCAAAFDCCALLAATL